MPISPKLLTLLTKRSDNSYSQRFESVLDENKTP